MAVKIDKNVCIGCGACVDTCPVGALDYDDSGMSAICDQDVCISCLVCTTVCPTEAISEEE